MINKSLLLSALATLPFAAVQAGSPILPLTDDGSAAIYFVADASVSYNDNIFYNATKVDDVIFKVAPGFELVAGGDGNSKFDLVYKHTLSAFADNDSLNAQLANVDAKYTYDAQSAFKASVDAGFHQFAQNTNQTNIVRDIVERNTFNAGATGEYKATEKSTLVLGAKYNGLRYTTYEQFFNDTDSFSVPASWYYAVTDKLDAGFTYQYSFTQIYKASANARAGDQQVHFFGLTTRGDVTEKLTLKADAGVGTSDLHYTTSAFSGADQSSTTFNFNLAATYAVTEKLTTTLSGGRQFSVGATGEQITSTEGNLGVNYAIDEAWSANAYVGYTVQEFGLSGRQDDIFSTGLGVTYALNKYWTLNGNYAFINDDVNAAGGNGDFNQSVLTFSASVKY